MPIQILMPALSPTMTEGTLATWLKSEGDAVAAGDVIAEIETDKATMEVEAIDEGTLARILVSAGSENVAVNTVIGLILEEGEDASALEDMSTDALSSATVSQTLEDTQPAATEHIKPPSLAGQKQASNGRVKASPLARRIAREKGLDLATVQGTGPHGRIIRVDVEAAIVQPLPSLSSRHVGGDASEALKIAEGLGMSYHVEPLSNMRKTIARRLSESKQMVPHFYLTADCEIDALLSARKQINTEHDLKISVNDMIVKASAVALRQVPDANVSYMGDSMLYYDQVDISVAVAIPGGLITPVVRKADQLGLAAISTAIKDLAMRAREGTLAPEEYTGGSFSISNLGMYGVKDFKAIINPPQACILAVGAGEPRPVVKEGALDIATVMTIGLSVDHRAVDGAVGANLLKAIKNLIENPVSMLI